MFEELKELELLEIDGGIKCTLHNRNNCSLCIHRPLFFKDPEPFAP